MTATESEEGQADSVGCGVCGQGQWLPRHSWSWSCRVWSMWTVEDFTHFSLQDLWLVVVAYGAAALGFKNEEIGMTRPNEYYE